MSNSNNKITSWKTKMDSYYKNVSEKKLIKDLTKAGFKINKARSK
ncbi:hypothetical protein PALU110988_21920 [Paenibacillus lupini]|nr:hypothetical protein [Paenibacillus lupini]